MGAIEGHRRIVDLIIGKRTVREFDSDACFRVRDPKPALRPRLWMRPGSPARERDGHAEVCGPRLNGRHARVELARQVLRDLALLRAGRSRKLAL